MTKQHTPQDTVAAMLANPVLPPGDDERFVGFGIMGLPFSNGHYLAMRQIPGDDLRAPVRVGVASRPVVQLDVLCHDARTAELRPVLQLGDPERRRAVRYRRQPGSGPSSMHVEIPGLLHWTVELQTSPATRLMGMIGGRLSESAWTDPTAPASAGPLWPDGRWVSVTSG